MRFEGFPDARGSAHFSYAIGKAERGGWVLYEFLDYESRAVRRVCANDEALYAEMRGWTERQIQEHRMWRADNPVGQPEGQEFLRINREASA